MQEDVAFGYKARKGHKAIEVNDMQALAVKRLFDIREQHPNWTLSEISFQLNQEGFTTQQGKHFTKVQVKRILDRRALYKGQYQYGGITATGLHQAIL